MTINVREGLAKIFNEHIEDSMWRISRIRFNTSSADLKVDETLKMADDIYKLGFKTEADAGLSRLFNWVTTFAAHPGNTVGGKGCAEETAFKVAEKMQLKA